MQDMHKIQFFIGVSRASVTDCLIYLVQMWCRKCCAWNGGWYIVRSLHTAVTDAVSLNVFVFAISLHDCLKSYV